MSIPPQSTPPTLATRSDIAAAQEPFERIRRQLSAVYLGDPHVVESMLVAVLARGHALLEGVPGVAKTTLVKAFATTLGCSQKRVQLTPDLLPADITGSYIFNPENGAFTLRKGPIFTQFLLADEINRAPARTQSALLEAMQEQQVTLEGERYPLPDPFFVLATQNPIELTGTYPLPEAQLDRFLLRISLGYPSLEQEVRVLHTYSGSAPQIEPLLQSAELLHYQSIVTRLHIEEDVVRYIVNLTRATRNHPKIHLGASPRAALNLLQAVKAAAFLQGREYVTPDDVQQWAHPIFEHRISLTDDLDDTPSERQAVLTEIVRTVPFRRSVSRP